MGGRRREKNERGGRGNTNEELPGLALTINEDLVLNLASTIHLAR